MEKDLPSYIRLTVQAGSLAGLLDCRLVVDEHEQSVHISGSEYIRIAPGHHKLRMSVWWMRRYGAAGMNIDIVPGQVLDVFYAPPYHTYASGAMGLTPQKREGLARQVCTVAAIVMLPVVISAVVLPHLI